MCTASYPFTPGRRRGRGAPCGLVGPRVGQTGGVHPLGAAQPFPRMRRQRRRIVERKFQVCGDVVRHVFCNRASVHSAALLRVAIRSLHGDPQGFNLRLEQRHPLRRVQPTRGRPRRRRLRRRGGIVFVIVFVSVVAFSVAAVKMRVPVVHQPARRGGCPLGVPSCPSFGLGFGCGERFRG